MAIEKWNADPKDQRIGRELIVDLIVEEIERHLEEVMRK